MPEAGTDESSVITSLPRVIEPEVEGLDFANLTAEDAEAILRELALGSIPTQGARLATAITDLLPVIQGSPAGVREAALPQIEQIQASLSRAFDTISQRLGRFGGGQVDRERGRAVGAAGGQLQNLFARQPAIAFQQLTQTLGGFSPTLLAQPPLLTATQSTPPDFAQLGADALNLINTGSSLFGGSPAATSGINPSTGQLIIGNTGTLGGGV